MGKPEYNPPLPRDPDALRDHPTVNAALRLLAIKNLSAFDNNPPRAIRHYDNVRQQITNRGQARAIINRSQANHTT